MVTTSPLGSVVFVGYHRPLAMAAPACQPVPTLNTLVFGKPCPSVMCPPGTSRRPPGRKLGPAQNINEGLGTGVEVPVTGCQTCGSPSWPQLRTVPARL